MKNRKIQILALVLISILAFQTLPKDVESQEAVFRPLPPMPPMVGITYSHRQSHYLEIDGREACLPILDKGFHLVRFAAYWDEIEREEGRYDFTTLDWQIAEAKKRGVPVVLVVGMKAPRWPEFFIPDWVMKKTRTSFAGELSRNNPYLRERTLLFIQEVVSHYKDEETIRYWQVENEPLDRSGAKFWWVDKSFVKQEVALVRRLDDHKKPILMTVATYPNRFVNFMFRFFAANHPIPETIELGDIVGINAYHVIGQRFWGVRFYFWIHSKDRVRYYSKILELVKKRGKEVWITELQAEPWEPGDIAYRQPPMPPSGWPEDTKRVFDEFRAMGFGTIFFWGAEYWQFRQVRYEDSKWWRMVEDLLNAH